MKIAYVLSYRAPDYIRGQSILSALRQIEGIELFEAINTQSGLARYRETLRQVRDIKAKHDPDLYFLGFRGHELYFALRHLVGNKPIIFDALMSPTASLLQERKFGAIGAAIAPALKRYERRLLSDAEIVLTDTELHTRFYCEEFGLAPEKILALPVGAIEDVQALANPTMPTPKQRKIDVLFYGSFLPLHGIKVILEAAAKLCNLPIYFHFVGGNALQARELSMECRHSGIANMTYTPWIPFETLVRATIPTADLCLGGPFGNTPQGQRVITGKTSQFLASAKATVVGHIDEPVGFVDKRNCLLVPQGNADALADALHWALEHRSQLPAIGQQGLALYKARLSIDVIRQRLAGLLDNIPKY